MKRNLLSAAFAAMTAMVLMAQPAVAQNTKVIEDGGTGNYKALMVGEKSLPTHTIFRPEDLSKFSKNNPLPVLVWGNGGCANRPDEHINFLNEIASHGFLIVAIGPSFQQEGFTPSRSSESKQLIDAIDWAIAQNNDRNSPYYNKIDTKNIAAAGMSCGGLQTLDIAKEPRLKTMMICNSGLFNQSNANTAVPGMPMPAKESLKDIHCPIIYILGGPTDIAYENGMDDFKKINHVPAFVANYPVGHGGTYAKPHGGEFAIVALAWLQWHLKGDHEAELMFSGENCGLSLRADWTYEKKMIP